AWPTLRLATLHLASRRAYAALGVIAVCSAMMRIALYWPWNSYGALQMPLILETACATVVAATAASPFGEPERAAGGRLPYLRLGTILLLSAATVTALSAAALGMPLAGGTMSLLRNTIGLIGIGLLCGAVLGGN